MTNLTIQNGNGEELEAFTAVRNAIFHSKSVVRNDGEVYDLPRGQKAGTETQKIAYATQMAESIIKSKAFKTWIA
jgi:hypothetical protein